MEVEQTGTVISVKVMVVMMVMMVMAEAVVVVVSVVSMWKRDAIIAFFLVVLAIIMDM